MATKTPCTELNSQQGSTDKPDGGEHRVSEDLFAVHDFEIKIDLDVPSGKRDYAVKIRNIHCWGVGGGGSFM